MKHLKYSILLIVIVVTCSSWGFYAHKKINETAVFLLPSELALFFKTNIKTITEKAVDADKRCYVDSLEGPRHYIDIDKFDDEIDSIPIHWSKAVERFSERILVTKGIVPWQVYRTYNNLVKAFAEKNQNNIIKYSADLGHYVADAHVPLHTTSNYNGQYSNQIGIHSFWETRLPEMFASQYNLFIGPARYIEDPLTVIWDIVKESNTKVDSVLNVEKELSLSFEESRQKTYLTRNNQLLLSYSDEYATAYHQALNGMVERRFRSSIFYVASLWYSAWVDAGQPKLSFDPIPVSMVDTPDSPTGKSLGREEWH